VLAKLRDVSPMLLEVLERLRGVVERRVGKLRQCVHQILRQLGMQVEMTATRRTA
jgi:hypothetical protein